MIANPLSEGHLRKSTSVFEALRRAYLDDLVHKAGNRRSQRRPLEKDSRHARNREPGLPAYSAQLLEE